MQIELEILITGAKLIDYTPEGKDRILGTRVYFLAYNNDSNLKACGYLFDENNAKANTFFKRNDIDIFSKVEEKLISRKNAPYSAIAIYEIVSTSKLPRIKEIKL